MADKNCNHEWGTDGMHSNIFCKKCFIDKPTSDKTQDLRERIASRHMVQCQKGEPFECPHLKDCPHKDEDTCQWQYECADQTLKDFDKWLEEVDAAYPIITKDKPALHYEPLRLEVK